jgi:hypothetical protein
MSDPGRARTVDPMIKSHLLYQLSYGVKKRERKLNIPTDKNQKALKKAVEPVL